MMFAGAHDKRRCGSLMPSTAKSSMGTVNLHITSFLLIRPPSLRISLEHRGKHQRPPRLRQRMLLFFSSEVGPMGKGSPLTCRVGPSSIRPVRLDDPIHDATGDQPRQLFDRSRQLVVVRAIPAIPPEPSYILAYHPRPGGADVSVARIALQEYRSQWPYPPQKQRPPRIQYLELTLLGTVGGPGAYAPEEQCSVLRPRVSPDVAGYHFVLRRDATKRFVTAVL
jgi:hypothetical protein